MTTLQDGNLPQSSVYGQIRGKQTFRFSKEWEGCKLVTKLVKHSVCCTIINDVTKEDKRIPSSEVWKENASRLCGNTKHAAKPTTEFIKEKKRKCFILNKCPDLNHAYILHTKKRPESHKLSSEMAKHQKGKYWNTGDVSESQAFMFFRFMEDALIFF